MSTATLDDFLALNEQLIALHEAGVALDPALGLGGNDVASNLARINAQVALRVRRGDSLIAALQAEDAALPPAYRALMQAGLRTGDWESTLNGHRRLSQSLERSRHVVSVGLIYPTVVCVAAFVGFLAFYRYVVPTLEELYGSLGLALTVAEWLRATLPLWSAAPLVALAALLTLRWRIRVAFVQGESLETHFASWLPGMPRTLHLLRCANFAETLATLVEHGSGFRESLQLAAATCGDPGLASAARELAARQSAASEQGERDEGGNRERGGVTAEAEREDSGAEQRREPGVYAQATLLGRSAPATGFPPFLRWALGQSHDAIEAPRALRIAAQTYRDSAERRLERFNIVAPLVFTVVIGGGATLSYALVLFAPLVQLLTQLS